MTHQHQPTPCPRCTCGGPTPGICRGDRCPECPPTHKTFARAVRDTTEPEEQPT